MKDILEFALNMERDGIDHYEQLAADAPHKGLEKIFHILADEERNHIKAIERLMANNPWRPQSRLIEDSQSIFSEMSGFDLESVPSKRPKQEYAEAYDYARTVEKKSVEFYQDKAEKAADASVKGVFLELAKQEEQHLRLMETLVTMVNRPNQWVEDAEFNHREEY